eukprot:TRINITY_DN1089_c0_g2_i1.p1 TRINITY_DN1089_c0_g2~~TRINITY_DN1089_c0_g2_i1.p1  ORF type:complete len:128 (-),score=29.75 TRINITY_DN1089_c0_g2_i1:75-458(-)
MAGVPPNFQQIGEQFVQHYYQTFDSNRAGVQPLYGETSMMTWEGEQFQGAAAITQKLVSLSFKTVQHQVTKADIQPSPPGAILIAVSGNLAVDGGSNPLKFAQVFRLAQTPQGGWFVQNDMFRLNIG